MPGVDKLRLYSQLDKAKQRYNLFCLEKAVVNVLVVALALALTAAIMGKFLGGSFHFYLLFLLPFLVYVSIALIGLHSSWLGLTRTAYFIDNRLNLKARLITALECAKNPNPPKFSDVLIAEVVEQLDDKRLKRTMPHKPPKTLWILIPLAIALPLVLLLVPNFHERRLLTAYKESKAHRLLNVPEYDLLQTPLAAVPTDTLSAQKEKREKEEDKKGEALDRDKRTAGRSPSDRQPQTQQGTDQKFTSDTPQGAKPEYRAPSKQEQEAKKEIHKEMNSIASLLAKLMPPPPQHGQAPPLPLPGMPQSSSDGAGGKSSEGQQDSSSGEQQEGKGKSSETSGRKGDAPKQESGTGGEASTAAAADARPSGQGGGTSSTSAGENSGTGGGEQKEQQTTTASSASGSGTSSERGGEGSGEQKEQQTAASGTSGSGTSGERSGKGDGEQKEQQTPDSGTPSTD
ncbi:MAG: hypothetical protein Q6359_10540, partial [Candidatus Brocadiales bacterium]|nr:hypothetical protein [Candidatus Brocadiales bacterium]